MNDIESHTPARPSIKDRPKYKHPEVSLVANEILSDGRLEEVQLDVALEQVSQYSPSASSSMHSKKATEANGVATTTPTASQQPPPRSFWIDVEIPNDADLRQTLVKHDKEEILDVLPSFLKRHLLYPAQMQIPQTLILAQSALIILRILPDNFEEGLGMRHAAAICLRGLLITITTSKQDTKPPPTRSTPTNSPKRHTSSARRDLLDRLDTTRRMMEQELPEGSTTAALSIWLQVHLQRVSIVVHRVRAQVLDMCERMDVAPHSVELSEIVSLKDTLLRILSVAEEQQEVLESLRKGMSITSTVDYSSTTLKPYIKALLATSSATERTAQRLDKRIAYVRNAYEALQQDRINRRLNVLTVFSAVFLPLTLMAGIWGMNFTNMPELEREHAYYYALGSMALVGLSMLCTFWRFGWFS